METATGAMGMAPDVFWSMTLAEFYAASEGFKRFHCASGDDDEDETDNRHANPVCEPMSRARLEELRTRYPD